MYKVLKKDVKAMRTAVPQWRIENDVKAPNISISNPVPGLFSRPTPFTIASSRRAAPPTSPALIPERRPQSSTSISQVTSSDINTLTREVIPGPFPALFPTVNHPASFDSDQYSQRTSLLSNGADVDTSRLDPIPIPGDLRVDIAPSSHSQEQEQVQEPELSVLDILLPIAAIQVTTANVEIISPTPVTSIRALPPISDIDLTVPVHQVPLPPSRPASRANTAGSPLGGISVLTLRGSVLIYPPTMENHTISELALQGYLDRDKMTSWIIALVRRVTSTSTQIRDVGSAPILDPLKRTGGWVWWNKLQIVEQRLNLFYLILLQQSLSSADL